MPQFPDQARQSFGPDSHLKRVLLDVDPLDEQLDDPGLVGREQFVPDRGGISEQVRDFTGAPSSLVV
jgi:hypothetical protein